MKLSLIAFALSAAIIGGCASHSSVAPTPAPVLPPTPPAPVAPVTPEPTPQAPEEEGPKLSPDGKRVMVKGDVWQLDVPVDVGWRPMRTDRYVLVLLNPKSRTLMILDREDWVKSNDDYAKEQTAKAKAAGSTSVTQRSVTINNRSGIVLDVKMGNGSHILEWMFSTGAEAFSLACGGPEDAFANNKVVCEDLVNHFYLGKKP